MTIRYRLGRCLLAERLDEARMTQADLSVKTGFTQQQISDWVHKVRDMSFATGLSIAEVIGCSPRDLYELKPYVRVKRRSRQPKE